MCSTLFTQPRPIIQKQANFGINTHTEKGQVGFGSPPKKLKFLEFELKTAFVVFSA